MKKILPALALLLMAGAPQALYAQHAETDKQGVVYYTPRQESRLYGVWIDDIEFGPKRTVVTMHYLPEKGNANLLKSTQLVCKIRGGKTKVLKMNGTCGINTGAGNYSSFQRGDVFKAYFPALDPATVKRVKSVDFLEEPSGKYTRNAFNITNIKIDKTQLVIR